MVDDEIHEGISQIISLSLANPAAAAFEALPYRRKNVCIVLLKGDDVIVSQNKADLLGEDLVGLLVMMERFKNYKKIIAEILNLGRWSLLRMSSSTRECSLKHSPRYSKSFNCW